MSLMASSRMTSPIAARYRLDYILKHGIYEVMQTKYRYQFRHIENGPGLQGLTRSQIPELRQIRLQAGREICPLRQFGFRRVPDRRRPGTFLNRSRHVYQWFDAQCLGIVCRPARCHLDHPCVADSMLRRIKIRVRPHSRQL